MARIARSSVYRFPRRLCRCHSDRSHPLLLLVLLFQRQIVSGLTNGAVKG